MSALYKMEGSGNDFLVGVGDWADRLPEDPDLVRRVCDRRLGIGADGTLSIGVLSPTSIKLVYFNADGGEARFCANGTRCAARAAVEMLGCEPQLEVITGWASISADVRGEDVALTLPLPASPPRRLGIEAETVAGEIMLFEVGVPHLVARVSGLADLDFGSVAPPLRSHPEAGPGGANVNLYEIIAVRSWERGVEGETLSCGSGLVAVALVAMAERGERRAIVQPASHDRLIVEALGDPPMCATRLTGPARFVAEIQLSDEFLAGS